MAFTKASFSGNVGAGSASNKLFVYSSDDTKATIIASGYFDDLSNIVGVGDMIMTAYDLDGTMSSILIQIDAITSGVVTVKALGGGVSGSFISDAAASTITVTDGIITAIV